MIVAARPEGRRDGRSARGTVDVRDPVGPDPGEIERNADRLQEAAVLAREVSEAYTEMAADLGLLAGVGGLLAGLSGVLAGIGKVLVGGLGAGTAAAAKAAIEAQQAAAQLEKQAAAERERAREEQARQEAYRKDQAEKALRGEPGVRGDTYGGRASAHDPARAEQARTTA